MGDPAGKMKQFATWFTHGVPGGAKLRAAIYQARDGADVLAEVERFFALRPTGEPDAENRVGLGDATPALPGGGSGLRLSDCAIDARRSDISSSCGLWLCGGLGRGPVARDRREPAR